MAKVALLLRSVLADVSNPTVHPTELFTYESALYSHFTVFSSEFPGLQSSIAVIWLDIVRILAHQSIF
jgi:hypothetical protein